MPDHEPPSGTFAPPPPGAPYEIAHDLQPDLIADQRANAREHERALRPLTYDQPGESLGPTPAIDASAEKNLATTLRIAAQHRSAGREATPTPAASDSDSPSRGMPKPITDPGKRITGGFGEASEAQYFALDGSELKELVRKLLDEVETRIANDLRFHLAITYPRVRVRVTVHVEGFGFPPFDVDGHQKAVEKTPVAVALAHGAAPVRFEIVAGRQEFNDADEPENPPDRIRDELGLQKPRKQAIQTAGGRQIVDRVTELGDSF